MKSITYRQSVLFPKALADLSVRPFLEPGHPVQISPSKNPKTLLESWQSNAHLSRRLRIVKWRYVQTPSATDRIGRLHV